MTEWYHFKVERKAKTKLFLNGRRVRWWHRFMPKWWWDRRFHPWKYDKKMRG